MMMIIHMIITGGGKIKPIVTKPTKEELKKLPIYVTDKPRRYDVYEDNIIKYEDWKGTYPFLSKEAEQKAPIASRKTKAVFKTYPSLVKEIQKTRPEALVVSSKVSPDVEGWQHEKRVFVSGVPVEKKSKKDIVGYVKRTTPWHRSQSLKRELIERLPFKEEPLSVRRRKEKRRVAETLFHELRHVQQYSKGWDSEEPETYEEYVRDPIEKDAVSYAQSRLLRTNIHENRIYKGGESKMKEINMNRFKVRKLRRPARRHHFRLDTDRDRIPDYLDCKPFNYWKQGESDFDYHLEEGELDTPAKRKEYYTSVYKKIMNNAGKKYGGVKKMAYIASQVAKKKLKEKTYSPPEAWDRRKQNKFVHSFVTSDILYPTVEATILEIYDTINDVYLYIDVSEYVGEYSSIFIDDEYMKGWGAGKSLSFILGVTSLDREKLGEKFDELLDFFCEEMGR